MFQLWFYDLDLKDIVIIVFNYVTYPSISTGKYSNILL